jgi:hypothetical protein
VESLTVIVPPYWGVPRVSHHFPVVVVVAVMLVGVDVVDEVVDIMAVVVVVVEIMVGVVVVAVVAVVFDELHDARTSESTRRKVIITQIALFFISLLFI